MDKIERVSVNGQVYELAGSGGGSGTPVSITYSELVALKNSSSLVAGTQYRITDYIPVFKNGIESGRHQFDIIVTAESSSSLKAKAQAAKHEGDEYFSENALYNWEIWYDIENNTSKYQFANADSKGYIYRMIDEYHNDVPWDFKNVMFGLSNTDNSAIPAEKGTIYFYTFSITDSYTDYSEIKDASISNKASNNQIKETNVILGTKKPSRVVISVLLGSSSGLTGFIANNIITDSTIIFSNIIMAIVDSNNIYARLTIEGTTASFQKNTFLGYTRIKSEAASTISNNMFMSGAGIVINKTGSLTPSFMSNIVLVAGTEDSSISFNNGVVASIININDTENEYSTSDKVENAIISGVSGELKIKKLIDLL